MDRGLGDLLYSAYQAAKAKLAEAAAAAREASGHASPAPPRPLPWRRPGSKQPAADAAAWLSGVVEAAEAQRAQLG